MDHEDPDDLELDPEEPEIGPVDEQGTGSPWLWVAGTVVVIALIAAAAAGGYWIATQGGLGAILGKTAPSPSPTSTAAPSAPPEGVACTQEAKLCPDGSYVGRTGPNCEFSPCPESTANPQASWKTYTNGKYSFSIMYPADYQVLTDKDSLSGWENGVALIYNGGQAYDVAIQVWDSAAQYQQAYPNAGDDLTVQLVKGKYITLFNATKEPGTVEIIATFKVL